MFSSDEATMKEDMHSWFKGLVYEEWFDPSEVPSTEVRKMHIETYAIVHAVN